MDVLKKCTTYIIRSRHCLKMKQKKIPFGLGGSIFTIFLTMLAKIVCLLYIKLFPLWQLQKKIFSNIVKITRHRGTGISTSSFFPLLQEQNNIRFSSDQGLLNILKISITSPYFKFSPSQPCPLLKLGTMLITLARQGPVLISLTLPDLQFNLA